MPPPTSSRVSSIQPGWDTTTTRSTDEAPRARSVRSRIGSPASRTNCFGISPPNRLPSPPARTIAWICTRRDYVRAASRDRSAPPRAGPHPPVSSVPSMVEHPPVRRAPTGVPDLELISVGWRRIQVLLRVRPVGGRLDPGGLRLRHTTSGATVPVTGWEADGDATTLRFNVMQGPKRQPLGTGRWELAAVGPGADQRPVRLTGDAAAGEPSADASFIVPEHGTIHAVASVGGRTGSFAITVEHDATRPGLRRRSDPGHHPEAGPARTARHRGPRGVVRRPVLVHAARRPPERPADPVQLRLARRPGREPQARLRPDARAGSRPRVRAADPVQARHRRKPFDRRSPPPAATAGPRGHRSSSTTSSP